jgi:hypothetical protein
LVDKYSDAKVFICTFLVLSELITLTAVVPAVLLLPCIENSVTRFARKQIITAPSASLKLNFFAL